ncbi:hypothetical protein PCC8801_1873 [Rippkaea orientalis PCC 8801]|uniref:DUF2281 domain-containing protein n=1 Tax=Rippkaea orientalis (strain PCC 8801 / RF-1) TaxID=41431 RepID=B7JXV1_RIPO1|nr:hypothetical protein [Rippkaea orientalis]ACK65915.1 hypothetical protein PCC8801_1873 [Rippkaea orientalis PCC 8801]
MTMTTKKIIQEKLQNLTEEQLNQVYTMIETLESEENTTKKPSLMTELQKISIDAPEDFSVQLAARFGREVGED